jgi:hypothetical protein
MQAHFRSAAPRRTIGADFCEVKLRALRRSSGDAEVGATLEDHSDASRLGDVMDGNVDFGKPI